MMYLKGGGGGGGEGAFPERLRAIKNVVTPKETTLTKYCIWEPIVFVN